MILTGRSLAGLISARANVPEGGQVLAVPTDGLCVGGHWKYLLITTVYDVLPIVQFVQLLIRLHWR